MACGQHGLLSRRETASLCAKCGCLLPAVDAISAKAIKLPRTAARRSRRKAAKSKGKQAAPLQPSRAAIVTTCKLCKHGNMRPYGTLEEARAALAKAAG